MAKKYFTDESLATLVDETKSYVDSAVSTKANSSHTHSISNVTNLQSSLDAKVPTSRTVNGKALSSDITLSAGDVGAATSGHTHSSYVNQNAFSNVKVGTTTVTADTITDTLEIAAGTGISVAGDATNDKVTITNSGVRSIATGGTNGTISVNTNGSSTNVAVKGLGSAAYTASTAYDAAGTAQTKADAALASAKSYTDTKIDALVGEGASETLDTIGEISAAIEEHQDVTDALNAAIGNKVDKVSGKGLSTNDYTTTEKNKLAGIAAGANAYTHPTTSGNKHIPSGGSSGQILRWSADGTAAWGADNNTTYTTFVKSGSGAASGLVPAPSTTAGTTKYLREDGTWQVPPDNNTTYSAAGTSLGLVKSGGDVTISSGVITVNDDSHNHTIANVDNLQSSLDGKAPTSHASTATTYGIGTSSNYGHVKLSDSTSSTSSTSAGIAATPAAVKAAYDLANGKADAGHTHTEYASKSLYDTRTINVGRVSGKTVGSYTIAFGDAVEASANFAQAFGLNSVAGAAGAHAEGANYRDNNSLLDARTVSIGGTSYSILGSTAKGKSSHAEGVQPFAFGYASHAEGYQTTASGEGSHAEGANTTAGGDYSHASGLYTKASSNNQFVLGKYNVEDTSGLYALIVGKGTSDSARSNAFSLTWDGVPSFAGNRVLVGVDGTGDATAMPTRDQMCAILSDLDSYLPLAGGTLTNSLTINNGFLNFTKSGEQDIVFENASSSKWKVALYKGGTSSTVALGLYDSTNSRNVWYYNTSGNLVVSRPLYANSGVNISDTTSTSYGMVWEKAGSSAQKVGIIGGTSSQNYSVFLWDYTNSRIVCGYASDGNIKIARNTYFNGHATIPEDKYLYFGTGYIIQDADGNMKFSPEAATTNRMMLGVSSGKYGLMPMTNGALLLGTDSFRWKQLYATTTTISTSDRNEKFDIEDVELQKASDFINALSAKTFKYIDGDSGRTHWGMIAQEVEDVMTEQGISDMDFAGFIRFQKEHIETKTKIVVDEETGIEEEREYEEFVKDYDEEGNPVYGYGLRYEEFIAPMIATIQKQHKEIEELKTLVNSLINK